MPVGANREASSQDFELPPEIQRLIGKQISRLFSSPPVSEGDIRRWAIATYWPELPPRLFWDPQFARETPFGGIVAPEDFNPFAWRIDPEVWPPLAFGMGGPTPGAAADQELINRWATDLGIGNTGLNAGGTSQYFDRIRPGDVITWESVRSNIFVRQGKVRMLFTETTMTWTNQFEKLVRIEALIALRR